MATSDISIYEKFKKRAKAEHACPLCERSFPSDHEHSEFLKLLENVISRMPGLLAESANKKQQLSDRLEQVEALRMRIDVLENQEIPPLKQEISQLKNEITGMQDIVDAKQSEIELLKKEEVQLQALRTNALEIDRLFRECAELESEGSRKFNADGDQSVRSVDELRTELNALQSEIQATSDKIAESQKQAGILREALQTLEINVGASRDKLDVAKSALLKKVRLEASLKASEESLDHLTREMRETGIELEERIDPKIERLRGQGEMNNRRLKIRENELISESEIWNKAYYELNSSFKQANSMLESELQSKLDDIVKNVINSLEEKMKSLQRIVQEKSAAMELAQRKSSDLAFVERNILDNIRLRDTCKRLDLLNQEITEAKRLFFNTFGDENLLKERVLNFQTQRSEIAGERSGLLGEIRQLNNQITSLSDELAKNYTNARENYDGQFLKVNIIAAAIEDLEVYAGALDKAIMQFHALKMCEINRLIRDLWMKTYRGADIDTIEIRSEAEGKPTNSATGNRSYNYRVVMIKGNTELDMRGRSSAGQRVLACLIIRLALAEAFGANCGVLALDEPTTNLDHDNISSLASSLCEIVRVRREQSNFQLIVITHDEEFVRQIGRSEYADYYFRVWKDKNQQSIIERQSINHIQH